jgi:ATP-dependent Clp protease ATP-binding subunit ClpA
MFERYTEAARRLVFIARHEAAKCGGPFIETEHLLLGLLHQDRDLALRLLGSEQEIDAVEGQIRCPEKPSSTSVDLPLSHESKRVLAYGAEEAERMKHRHIGTEHLLLGLLREEGCRAAQALREAGLELASVREQIAGQPQPETAYDELHRLVAGLPPEQLEAAARALRALKTGAPIGASARFVSSSAGQPGLELLTGYGSFEGYTEQARRAIFFARYEASQFGTQTIESEHLVLGILHEHWRLAERLHRRKASANRTLESKASTMAAPSEIRKEIEQRKPPGPKTPTSVDLPLSIECQRAMTFAAEEARLMKHRHIGNEHLVVGLLREKKCLAAELLRAHGVDLEEARKDLRQGGSA